MMFLLDTHILLWWLTDPDKLSKSEYEAIENGEHHCYISAASIWEMAIKSSLNKLKLPLDLSKHLKSNDFEVLPIDFDIAMRVKEMPYHHYDPFDRLIIATAQHHHLTIITHDPEFDKYE